MKRYLITGASRGIGRAIALRLAAPDVMLLLHGRDTVALAETCRVADKIGAKTTYPNWSIYCGSKFALEGLSTAIREELRSRKVRMLNIYPAATDTDIWNAVSGEWPREQMMSAADVANAVAFAINQPPAVIIENITLSNTAGSL